MKRFVRYAALGLSFSLSQLSVAAEWVGTPAPSFHLSDQTGKMRQLADFKGKWLVMYFYPKNHTSGCTEEAKRFRDQYPQFQKQNINIVGVSLDTVASHKSFAKDYHLPFTLLADTNKELAKQMGVLRGFSALSFASRQTFLIDPQGTIVYHYANVKPETHATEILADVAKLSSQQ